MTADSGHCHWEPCAETMPELGFHAAQNVIDVSAVVALSLYICIVFLNMQRILETAIR